MKPEKVRVSLLLLNFTVTNQPNVEGEGIERKAFDGERVEGDESSVVDVNGSIFLDESPRLLRVLEI